jgi:competence protein ComEC
MGDPARLPRSAWLAFGTIGAALAAGNSAALTEITAAIAVALVFGAAVVQPYARGRDRARLVTRSGLTVALGMLLILARVTLVDHAPVPAGAGSQPDPAGRLVGIVESVGSPKAAEQIALLRLSTGPDRPGAQPLVEALLPRYPEIGAGDGIALRGSVQPPGDDDFGDYLRRLGADGSVRSSTLELLAGPAGLEGFLDRLRRGSAEVMTSVLPEPQAGLADGILIGLRERVDRDLAAAFTTAGVSHIVAISGWNIAIVAAMVAALLGSRVGSRPRTVIILVAIVGYTLVAGASPSVDRAATMAAIGLTARSTGRSSSAVSALGWAVILLLLLDPAIVADPGFALSGLATAGLIGWSTPLTERLHSIRGHRLPRWLAESLAISLAAEAATLPLVLLVFGRLAIIAPLANLAIVPLVPPAMAAGAVALGAGWLGAFGLPQPVVTLLGLPAWALLGLVIGLVRSAAGLPFASVTLAPPLNILAAAGTTAVLGWLIGSPGAAQLVRDSAARTT